MPGYFKSLFADCYNSVKFTVKVTPTRPRHIATLRCEEIEARILRPILCTHVLRIFLSAFFLRSYATVHIVGYLVEIVEKKLI